MMFNDPKHGIMFDPLEERIAGGPAIRLAILIPFYWFLVFLIESDVWGLCTRWLINYVAKRRKVRDVFNLADRDILEEE